MRFEAGKEGTLLAETERRAIGHEFSFDDKSFFFAGGWRSVRHVDYAGRNPPPTYMPNQSLEREILRPLWKVHILFHAQQGPIVGHWMLEELREHGYRVSPGTLYPLLARMEKLGWLERVDRRRKHSAKDAQHYRATAAGRRALREINVRLKELIAEIFDKPKS